MDCLIHGKRCHVFGGSMDGDYKIPDFCDAQQRPITEMITLSGKWHSRCSCQQMLWHGGSESDRVLLKVGMEKHEM